MENKAEVTFADFDREVLVRERAFEDHPRGSAASLLLGALGVAGEACEVASLFKRIRYGSMPSYLDALRLELGDVLWYTSLLAQACDLGLGDVAQHGAGPHREGRDALAHFDEWVFTSMPSRASDPVMFGTLGLVEAAGVVAEDVKKHVFHGRQYSRELMLTRLTDVLMYVSYLAQMVADSGLAEVAMANVEKLRRRYPDGFSPEAAAAREDEKQPEKTA